MECAKIDTWLRLTIERKYVPYLEGLIVLARDDEVQEWLEAALNEEDDEKRTALFEKILERDPDNPVARYIKWGEMDEKDALANLGILLDAARKLNELLERPEGLSEFVYSEYVMILSDIAFCLYANGEEDGAMEVAENFMAKDREGGVLGRIVHYSLLIKRGKYDEAIESASSDTCVTLMGEYCRAIALFETEGVSDKASDALLEAVSLDPEMAFFIMGLWELGDEEMETIFEDEDGVYMHELIMQAERLSELWNASEERIVFLGTVVFALGYLTGRVVGLEDVEMLEETYRTIGCFERMSEARDTLQAMLEGGHEPEEVDEKALDLFKEMKGQGLFNA